MTALEQKNPEHSYFIKALVGTFHRITSLITSTRCWENTSITVNHDSKGIVVLTYPLCDIVAKMIKGSQVLFTAKCVRKLAYIFKTTTLLNAFFRF